MQQTADGDAKTGKRLLGAKVARVSLARWTRLEIEMLKSQLREYRWIREENNNCNKDAECKPRVRRKRRRGVYTRNPYCRSCHRYFKNYPALASHRQLRHSAKEEPPVLPKEEKRESEVEEYREYNEDTEDKEDVEEKEKEKKEKKEKEENEEEDREDKEDAGDEKFEWRPLVSCKDCKLSFATTREIFEHRRYLGCATGCPRGEESDLSDTTDVEYEYDRLYACDVCRGKFVSAELLREHRRRERHPRLKPKGRRRRGGNGLVVVKREPEDFTFRSVEENEYACATCVNGLVYHDPDDLVKHQRAVHSGTGVYCRYCSHRLSSAAEFMDHHRGYHELLEFCRGCGGEGDAAAGPPRKPLCLGCCRRLRLPHDNCLSLLKENLYCESCERALPSLEYVRFHYCAKRQHRQLALPILACPLCAEPFNGLRSLYRHIIRHSDIMAHRCDECGKLHETWKALKDHATKCHFNSDLRLPRVEALALRRSAISVVRRFVKNGVSVVI